MRSSGEEEEEEKDGLNPIANEKVYEKKDKGVGRE